MEVELYPGTTIAFSREIEKTDSKNVRWLKGEKALAPFPYHAHSVFPYIDLVFATSSLGESLAQAKTTKTVRYSLLSAKRGSTLRYTTVNFFAQFPFNSGCSI